MNKGVDQVSQLHSRPVTAVQPRWCVSGHYREEESRSLAWGERDGSITVNTSELRTSELRTLNFGVGSSIQCGTLREEFFVNGTVKVKECGEHCLYARFFRLYLDFFRRR
ncbi:hypothetical protein TNCV_1915551 [Trichonephila clavipes]|uniref:Uncharacterized protein n=1 Tax=Trichonephila clavipes TaxID=2585209 RepID=A0A8X6W088_TRICX|nr:hypothetical protein TNCV_1915551 [Trichonephila clavipes]